MNEQEGRWVTIAGRRVFIRNKGAKLVSKIFNKQKQEKSPTEHYIQLIVDEINNNYEKMDKEDKEWANTFEKYLDVMGYDSSKDFKADILWLATNNDNENYRNGNKEGFNFNLNDSGEIQDGQDLVSYRKVLNQAKKRIKYFNPYLDDNED